MWCKQFSTCQWPVTDDKDNQPDLVEAMHTAFDRVDRSAPDARSAEKRGP